jgi:hypothetical protein
MSVVRGRCRAAAPRTVRRGLPGSVISGRCSRSQSWPFMMILFGLLAMLVRSDLSKDAELLVLRHENQVLRRQLSGRPQWDHAGRLWLTALSRLVNRRQWPQIFPVTPGWGMRLPRPRCGRSCTLRASTQRLGGPGRPDSPGSRDHCL